jgi:hypothetical protein
VKYRGASGLQSQQNHRHSIAASLPARHT